MPATFHRTYEARCFHGWYSVERGPAADVNRRRKGAAHSLAALKSSRAARPGGASIYVIMDNLSAHKGLAIRRWAKKNKVELCIISAYASLLLSVVSAPGGARCQEPDGSW
ncbi:hypothetical protein [Streptomyces sp. CA-179760]|uniref:hypothetical protein n=1 Tax=Streptomyces sp. CA-179760 TaxID=3240054 RepID=UPI003D8C4308